MLFCGKSLYRVCLGFLILICFSFWGCEAWNRSSRGEFQGLSALTDHQDQLDEEDLRRLFFSAAYAVPQYVLPGQPVTIYWNAPFAERVEVSGTSTSYPRTGAVTVFPLASLDYSLTAYNRVMTVRRTIHVEVVPFPGFVQNFWADPVDVVIGDTTYLRWMATQCDYVMIREEFTSSPFYRGACGYTDQVLVQPTRPTRYIVEAYRYDRVEASGYDWGYRGPEAVARMVGKMDLSVGILDRVPEVSLGANMTTVHEGQPVHIYWSVKDGEAVMFEPAIVSNPGSAGSVDIIVPKSTSIKLSALSKILRQKIERVIDINVLPSFKFKGASVTPEVVSAGGKAWVSFSSEGCRNVMILMSDGTTVGGPYPCTEKVEVSPQKSTNYILRFFHDTSSGERVEDVPLSVSVLPSSAQVTHSGPSNESSKQSTTKPHSPGKKPPIIPEIVLFSSDRYRIKLGEPLTLFWTTKDAVRVEILLPSGKVMAGNAVGERKFKPRMSGDVVLTAVAANGRKRSQLIKIEVLVEKNYTDDLLKHMTQ